MRRLQSKSFAKPDRARNLGSGRVDLVDLDETVVGRVTLPAGWRWSKDVRPVVQTVSCKTRHVSYAMGGILHVAMDDGTEFDLRPGDVGMIAPGHDAWTVGDEACVALDTTGVARYAKRD